MKVRKFTDREEELAILERHYAEDGFKFLPLYGRRRIGKTALIKEFCANHQTDALYYLCTGIGLEKNINYLAEQVSTHFGIPPLRVQDLRALFSSLKMLAGDQFIFVLDEFPELVHGDRGVLGDCQFIVDELLADTNWFLILCGSSIGMMQDYVLSQTSPLFGRRTGQLQLGPIRYDAIHHFLERYSFRNRLAIQSMVGGIPRYLLEFGQPGRARISSALKRSFFSADGYLYREAFLLLRDELREPDAYMSILEAIAAGKTRVTQIANAAYMAAKDMSKYLNVLQRLGIVERIRPVGASPRSKKSIYEICDPYFRFWFRFVSPHRGAIEFMHPEVPLDDYRAHKSEYFGRFWERYILTLVRHRFGGRYRRIGRWWYKGTEVDIVGLGAGEVLIGEVKWTNRKVGCKQIEQLLDKGETVVSTVSSPPPGDLDQRVRPLMVSRAGFTRRCVERMDDEGIIHWSLADVERMVVGGGVPGDGDDDDGS